MQLAGTDDVLVVGCGPVGQMTAILLAQQGLRVRIVERFPTAYARPRAVHYDHEIARAFAAAGVGEEVAAVSEVCGDYDWQNAAGETLLHFDGSAAGRSGWPASAMFSQPALEAVLDRRIAALPGISLHRGETVIGVADLGDHVEVLVRGTGGAERTRAARYVVGCDGANSTVRAHLGAGLHDLGFSYDWLIVDVVPREPRAFSPPNLQICDPSRPTTVVSGGPGRRRWEFMRLPHETPEELGTEETAWRLLRAWDLSPADAVLERHTVYTFQARWADRWRRGRLLLAGDAAHLMPPFAGQGLCSGIRDAVNLAWKLALVIRDRAPDGLLDSYASERLPHVQQAIGLSVELGNVICVADPALAAERDAAMLEAAARSGLASPPPPEGVLGPGILHVGAADAAPAAGRLGSQSRVATVSGAIGRFDQVVGTGFVVAVRADAVDDAASVLSAEHVAGLTGIGAHLVLLAAPGSSVTGEGAWEVVTDVDDHYLSALAVDGHVATVTRPDFYVFGAAKRVPELVGIVADLLDQLGVRDTAAVV